MYVKHRLVCWIRYLCFPWPDCQPSPSSHNCARCCWWCWHDWQPSDEYAGECWWWRKGKGYRCSPGILQSWLEKDLGTWGMEFLCSCNKVLKCIPAREDDIDKHIQTITMCYIGANAISHCYLDIVSGWKLNLLSTGTPGGWGLCSFWWILWRKKNDKEYNLNKTVKGTTTNSIESWAEKAEVMCVDSVFRSFDSIKPFGLIQKWCRQW